MYDRRRGPHRDVHMIFLKFGFIRVFIRYSNCIELRKKDEGLKYDLFGNFKNLEIIYFIYNLDFSSGIFSLKFDFFSSDFFNLRILPIFEIFMTSWFEFWKFLKICPRETIHFFQILTTLLYHLRYYIYTEETKYIKYDIIFKPALEPFHFRW